MAMPTSRSSLPALLHFMRWSMFTGLPAKAKPRHRRLLGLVTAFAIVVAGLAVTATPATAVGTPTIQSDKDDYPPGGLVTLTGAGWQPGEAVHIYVNDDQGKTWERYADVGADEEGALTDSFKLPDWFVATYKVTATGQLSGVATTSFTDGNLKVGASNATVDVTMRKYATADCTGAVTTSSTLSASPTQPGTVGVGSNESVRLDAPATAPNGALFTGWTLEQGLQAVGGTSGGSICLVGFQSGSRDITANYVARTATATTLSSGTNPSVYGNAVTFTATVTSSPNPNSGTVTFKDGATVLCNTVPLVGNQATCTTPGLAAGTLQVGSHSVAATYNPAGTYLASTSSTLSQQVSKRILTGAFTADNKVYDGTTAATIATRSLSGGTVPGDVVSLAGGAATFDNKAVGTGKLVTGTGFSLTGADAAAKYLLSSATLTTNADIGWQGVTVSFTAGDKVYDGNVSATITGRTLSDVVSGDDVTVAGGTAAFATGNAGTGKSVAASGFTLGGADAANYSVVGVNPTTADITPKPVTGSFQADDKVYDGNSSATVDDRSLNGVVAGDAVALSGGTATFTTKNVGTAKTVTLSGAALSGADKDNYTLGSVATTTADITPRPVTGSFTAGDKVYDGNTSATVTGRSLNGALSADAVTLSGGTATFDTMDVGTGKTVMLAGAVLDGDDKGNYTLASVGNSTADITPRPLTGEFTAAGKVYDGDSSATVTGRSLNGVVAGDAVALSGGTATFGNRDVGIGKTVSLVGAVLDGEAKANYTLASVGTTTADITAKTVTGSFTASDKPYDGNRTAQIATRSLVGVVGADDVELSGGDATFDTRNAGVGKTVTGTGFSLAGDDSGNYLLQSSTLTATASITRMAVVGHFVAEDKVYDGTTTATVTSRTVTGVVGNDDVALVGGTASFGSKNAGIDKTVTLVGAELSGTDAENYSLGEPTLTTTASVTRRTLLISADDQSKVYGDANPVLTGSMVGVQNDDPVTLSLTSPATAASGVGGYAIVPHAEGTEAVLANYTVEATNGILTVTKAPLSLKADPKSKVYGQDNPALTFSVEGLVNGDTRTTALTGDPVLDTTAVKGSSVGDYPIVLTGGTSENYELTRHDSTLSVTKAPLTLTADDQSKVYGDANPVLTGSMVGVQNDDPVTLSLTSPATAASGVGGYAIVPHAQGTEAVLANYTVESTNGTLSVTRRTLSIAADDQSKVYGDANPVLTGSMVGVQNDDPVTLSLTSPATAASGVGGYAIVPHAEGTEAVLANYTVEATNGTLSVTKAPLVLRADPKSKVYGADNPVLSFSVEGLVNGDTVATALTEGPALATTALKGSDVGDYPISLTGGTSHNYQLSREAGTLSVTKAPLVLKADPKTKILGADNPVLTFSVEGLVTGDSVATALTSSPTPATTAVKASSVGSYPITLTGGTSHNYELSRQGSTLTVIFGWNGFLQPINDTAHQTGVNQSKFRLGQTIPVRFELRDALGNLVQQTGSPTFTRSVYRGACDATAVPDTVPTVAPDGGATYNYNGGQYHYNWSTKSISQSGEYRIFANLADGTARWVDICLTK